MGRSLYYNIDVTTYLVVVVILLQCLYKVYNRVLGLLIVKQAFVNMKLRKLLNTTLFNTNIGMSTDIVNLYGCTNLPTYIECDVLRCMLTQVISLFIMNILIGLWLHMTPSSCRTWCCTIDLTKYNKLLKISFRFKVTTVTYYAHS